VHILHPSDNAAIDLCILSRCNHTIATTGTFGWWVAFLANGTSIFQRNYVRLGSAQDEAIRFQDYFMPNAMLF
jgi:galactoside 2-L-fucosyltransferase 1/2